MFYTFCPTAKNKKDLDPNRAAGQEEMVQRVMTAVQMMINPFVSDYPYLGKHLVRKNWFFLMQAWHLTRLRNRVSRLWKLYSITCSRSKNVSTFNQTFEVEKFFIVWKNSQTEQRTWSWADRQKNVCKDDFTCITSASWFKRCFDIQPRTSFLFFG